jgi:carboxypeptidase Taq
MKALDALKARLLEVNDLERAGSLLHWDLRTYMPPGGAAARSRQIATLYKLRHELFTDKETGRLLDAAAKETESLPYESDEAAFVRVTRREWDQEVKRPTSLVAEIGEHNSKTYHAWTEARPANDFARMRPLLEKTLELSRRVADCYPGYEHIADPLIDFADYGMKVSTLRGLFTTLRNRLVPLVQAIASRPLADNSCLRQRVPLDEQLAFGLEVIRRYGYDFKRGRQDLTHHPFMTKFSLGDVRITTRYRDDDFTDSLFSTLHECGHALYEQGIAMRLDGSPLGGGTSSGIHESQSRLWENVVGRSRGFWEHFYPRLRDALPSQLRGVSVDTFYGAINRVERSLIRTDADEVTYNLHVMIRFELELDMLEGKLAIADLPRAWRERFEEDMGIPVPDDKDGVLQDVHWYDGLIGGQFQGYTIGNVLSAQFFDTAVAAHKGIPDEIKKGEFDMLLGWLRENVYQHGSKFTPSELVRRATGQEMTVEPYIQYLWRKYQPLYSLPESSLTEGQRVRS